MKRKLLLAFFFSIFFLEIFSQNLNGTWEGNFEKDLFSFNPLKLVVDLSVTNDSIVTGSTHLYYRNNHYEHYLIQGRYNKTDSTIYFSETTIISVKLTLFAETCLGNYKMKLKVNNSLMQFDGMWRDNKPGIFSCPATKVSIRKSVTNDSINLTLKQNDSLSKQQNLKLLRNTVVQSLIELGVKEKDSIKVEVYDNGEIDDDYVSIYFNDSLIINNKRISVVPISFYLNINEKEFLNKIKLVAESLGKIPPCTALMIITTKKKRYELNLSSSLDANASVEFFMKDK